MSSYASPADLTSSGINSTALTGITNQQQQDALDRASSVADGYFASRYVLPLVAPFPADLKRAVCAIAAYDLIAGLRGYNPEGDPDLRNRYEDAMTWLRDVSRSLVTCQVGDSSGSTTVPVAPAVYTSCKRGW